MQKNIIFVTGLLLIAGLSSCGSSDEDQQNTTMIDQTGALNQDPAYTRCGTISYDPNQAYNGGSELILRDSSNNRIVRLFPDNNGVYQNLLRDLSVNQAYPGFNNGINNGFNNGLNNGINNGFAGGFAYSYGYGLQYGHYNNNNFAASVSRSGCVYSQYPQQNTAFLGSQMGQFNFSTYRLN